MYFKKTSQFKSNFKLAKKRSLDISLFSLTGFFFIRGFPIAKNAKEIIESNVCFYSYASFWKISIKPVYEIDDMCRLAGFGKLPVTLDEFNRVRNLPFQENIKHNDPFDRILISQAIENDLTIVTTDGNIPLYDVKTIW